MLILSSQFLYFVPHNIEWYNMHWFSWARAHTAFMHTIHSTENLHQMVLLEHVKKEISYVTFNLPHTSILIFTLLYLYYVENEHFDDNLQ